MPTIKVKSTDEASQGPYVIINKTDFNPEVHEPFDDESRAALAGSVASSDRVPTMTELLAARDQLLARERELAEEKERVAELGRANEAEAQRLRDEAVAQAAAAAKKPGIAELRDQLTAKGIAFDPAATKAELQALLG